MVGGNVGIIYVDRSYVKYFRLALLFKAHTIGQVIMARISNFLSRMSVSNFIYRAFFGESGIFALFHLKRTWT